MPNPTFASLQLPRDPGPRFSEADISGGVTGRALDVNGGHYFH